MDSFFFVTREISFEETKEKGARLYATFMELDKASVNGRIYRFAEGIKMAKSLIGKPVFYGVTWFGKHDLSKAPIGIVETAEVIGKKIKGIVRVTDQGLIETLKQKVKYMFSVGGIADFAENVKEGGKQLINKFGRPIIKLYNAVCTHLQLLDGDPKKAGFESAKMERLIEINESALQTGTIMVCEHGTCKILQGIKEQGLQEYEENLFDNVILETIGAEIKAIGVLIGLRQRGFID